MSSTTQHDARLASEREALERCEREPFHNISLVQPFGCLIACTRDVSQITRASANVRQFVGHSPEQLLGSDVSDHLPRQLVHALRNTSAHSTIESQREYVGDWQAAPGPLEVAAYATSDELVLDVQPAAQRSAQVSTSDRMLRVLARTSQLERLDDLFEMVVEELRDLTGFDRVKAYRFQPDGCGEVVAESRSAGMDSFLGLRFPAHDIPQSARRLYATTPLRIIASVEAEQVPILSAHQAAEPLDLSLSVLRGTVPAHVQFLQNMGVGATLSVPIVVHGKMWGLFAHHHRTPRMPDIPGAMCAELIGHTASLQIQAILDRQHARRLRGCATVASSLFMPDDSPLGISAYWSTTKQDLAELLPCNGVALVGQSRIQRHGQCPSDDAVYTIAEHAAEHPESAQGPPHVMAVDSISELPGVDLDHTDGVCGALVLPNPVPAHKALMFFRGEARNAVRWAGNPDKTLEAHDDGLRLKPRASFAAYLEHMQHKCEPWSYDDIDIASALAEAFVQSHRAAEVHLARRERLGLVVRELNHRVRNILALVQSLVSQTRSGANTLPDYIQALELRIAALADAHRVLTESDWQDVDLGRLLRQVIYPYQSSSQGRIRFHGPPVKVAANLASLMSLVFHEIVSNAAKYGALSVHGGVADLSWHPRADRLTIEWVESGGPVVHPPQRIGFGTTIVRNALPFEYGGTSEMRFEPDGLRVSIELPIGDEWSGERPAPRQVEPPRSDGYIALVVEDDYLISREMTALLSRHGAAQVLTASTLDDAMDTLARSRPGFVLLDANLRGQFSGPVAERLVELDIPFSFVTGYGSQDRELRKFPSLGVLTKPVRELQIVDLLRRAELLDGEA